MRTSGLAVAALITALCGLGPIALGLGIGALITVRSTRMEGQGMAIAGIAIGAVETLLLTVAIGLGVAAGGDPAPAYDPVDEPAGVPADPSTDEPEGALRYIDQIVTGSCFNEGTEDDDEGEVYVVRCERPHDAELIATVVLPAGPYPGGRGIEDKAEAACDREFAKYVGTTATKTSLSPSFWTPDRETWESGDRSVICVTGGPDGELLTGSVKGTKR